MSILIKGMEMPKCCGECVAVNAEYDVMPHCRLTATTMCVNDYYSKRLRSCPLIEVKAPHGDLIDRDAILSFIDAGHLSNPATKSWNDTDVVDMLESRPTVIEAEG